MEWLGSVGIFVALAIIIFLAMRSYSILIVAPICALLVILTNRMEIAPALLTAPNSFMAGVGGFISSYLFVFLLGAVLAKLLEDSGAAQAIAKWVLSMTGTESPYKVMLALFFVSALLTYGGVSLFVAIFALVPLARPIFKEMNMPWHLAMIPIGAGLGTFTMTMLPGTPSVQNVVPTVALGTTLMAAPVIGLTCTLVVIVFVVWYMKIQVNKAIQSGEGYVVTSADAAASQERELPSLGLSLAPMIVLIGIIFVGSFIKVPNIILIALAISIIIAVFLFKKYIPNLLGSLNTGATNSLGPVTLTAVAIGFGAVVMAAPGFQVIGKWFLSIPGSPLISLSVVTGFFSAVTGSAAGGLGIVMQAFASTYVNMGIAPEAIHRIAAIASGFGSMPHSGAILATLALMGLNHKEGYRHLFMTNIVGSFLALVVGLILAVIIY